MASIKIPIGVLYRRTKYAYVAVPLEGLRIYKFKLNPKWKGKKIPIGTLMLLDSKGRVRPLFQE